MLRTLAFLAFLALGHSAAAQTYIVVPAGHPPPNVWAWNGSAWVAATITPVAQPSQNAAVPAPAQSVAAPVQFTPVVYYSWPVYYAAPAWGWVIY